MTQPFTGTITDFRGYLQSITSPTIGSMVAAPVSVCFTDVNGNEYALSGANAGSMTAAPLPVVLCNSQGQVITPPITVTSNGNKITISSVLSGKTLGAPRAVMLTDVNGVPLSIGGAVGAFVAAPASLLLCDFNGKALTVTASTFAYLLLTDTFHRANGSLGANWTAESGSLSGSPFIISSNTAVPTDGTHNAASFWSANTFSANQFSEAIISGGGSGGAVVFASTGDNYYRAVENSASHLLNSGKSVGGTFTALNGAGVSETGTLVRVEMIAGTQSWYVDGTLAGTSSDSSLTSGAPGIAGYSGGAAIAITQWRGGDLVWTRQGTVIAANHVGTSGLGNQEPTVIYEGNAKILSGNVFKMWHTDGWTSPAPVINYAESTDGITWTEYSSNPVMATSNHGGVFKIGATYYGYMNNNSNGILDQWTSSDGVAWTKAHTAVLSPGTTGTWDAGGIFNPFVWQEGSTWYMLYEGGNVSNIYAIGLATSTDGITWVKDAANPVLTNSPGSVSGPDVHKIGNTYYMLTHTSVSSNIPSDVSLYSSTDLHTWTASTKNPIVERELADEGANKTAGQLADCSAVEVSGTTYLFNDATAVQSASNIHINLRTTPHSLATILPASM